ncbi:endonuclease MutS2 [Pelobacter propionicus]|uniref:Endonuclease MutS2 n=1 Tax=Pelobacter propionicus (strain DSM 2379 / NBRC 103807 / OttBd1) TaxID=338966 RepID=A1AT62_PELPD|nr:endonuclease MutS2 [Pelobacter propionicus]ABL00533.1 MutS2 family protein [Pelobacter propionicus DSM 2379]
MISHQTLKRLEFDKILAEISGHVHSEVTAARLMDTVPLSDGGAIASISGRIEEIRSLASQGIALRLQPFQDIRPLMELLRPVGAFLGPRELLIFIPVLEIFGDIARQFAPRNDIPLLKGLDPPLKGFADILEPLAASIDQDGGIMDSASTALREIRRAKRSLASRIRKKIEEIVRDNNIEIFLQDDFITQRSGRWVIPVRMDSKGMVKGVVHDVSSSGETAFMEPLEIIPFVNELENLSAEEKAEEIRILRQLSSWIRQDAAEISACFETLLTLDELASIARFADTHALEPPSLNGEGVLRLAGARHPLLLMLQAQGALSRVEPLDLQLGGEGTVMVITGPNAGGKTIALKTAGVLVLMALCGMPVPADGASSTFPLLDDLLVDMGDEQSIEQSLSTFSAHVSRVAAILEQAGPRSLVLLDELGAGTEPQQGAAIACGVLRELRERGAMVIATTHLSEIIGYVHATEGMVNAGMEYDAETYTPLYRLISGQPGHSHAIEIARRYGMPDRVISFAREMLGTASEEFTSLLAELHRKRGELEHGAAQLEREREQVRAIRRELEARSATIEQARQETREKAWADAREVISTARRRMNELLDEYRRERRSESIEKLRRVEAEVTEQLSPRDLAGDDQPLGEVAEGDSVRIRSLGHDGRVLQLLPKQGRARVRAGSMELEVPLSDLVAPLKQTGGTATRPSGGDWRVQAVEEGERELKLIGLRVEEALALLDPFLSQASLGSFSEVRIIHGLGSGRLRQAVREHLAHHQLVEEFRPGNAHEGRDGATVVTLRR